MLHFASFPSKYSAMILGVKQFAHISGTLSKCSLTINSLAPCIDSGVWDMPLKDSKWKSYPPVHVTKLGAGIFLDGYYKDITAVCGYSTFL